MSAIPRIVIVDDATHDVKAIVQGALSLLNRQAVVVDVPQGETALQELKNTQVDLIVTAQTIQGDLDGLTLAARINRESLGTPVIVIGAPGDPAVDSDALRDRAFQYYVRPAVDGFVPGLRAALDGTPLPAVGEGTVAAAGTDLGPVPAIDIDELRNVLVPLVRDLGAMGVILADRNGRVLVNEGATGYVDRDSLATLLGPSFARTADLSDLIGGQVWTMHYYDGERLNVFGLALGVHYFMCLLFEGSNRSAFGAVTMFGRRAADQMIEMIGEDAYRVATAPPPPPPPRSARRSRPRPVSQGTPAPSATESAGTAADTPQEDEPGEVDDLAALFDEAESEPLLEPVVDFDENTLFGQEIDESLADQMFDENALSDLASTLVLDEDERVDFDEAMDMGIVGLDE